MRRPRPRALATLAVVATSLGATAARAQAPVAGLHTSMGPGAGLPAAVGNSGGYATTVPLDLPAPRVPIPVPVSVVHNGSPRAGVAGLGWDVPLSYIRQSASPRHRKPAADPTPGAGQQLRLVLDGASSLMVAQGDHYVPFVAGAYRELRYDAPQWRLTTLDDLEYVFSPAATIADGDGMADPDLWLLDSIRDRGGRDTVDLEYAVDGVGACGKEVRLVEVRYTFDHPNYKLGKPLYSVQLDYAPWWRPGETSGACAIDPSASGRIATAYEHADYDGLTFGRVRLLERIRVVARDNLAPSAPPRVVRAYHFAYDADLATAQPRLTDVTSTGEEGTAAGLLELPVARYGYGPTAELVPGNVGGASGGATEPAVQVAFGLPTPVARLFVLPGYGSGITTTVTSEEKITQGILYTDVGWRTTSKLRHVLRDFTGDGLPDLLYRIDGWGLHDWHWQLHVNRLTPAGPDLSGTPITWGAGEGPAELQLSTTLRFDHPADDVDIEKAMVTTETWSTFADWNGDGRIDVIDADGGADRDHWQVWINHAVGDGIAWQPVQVDVAHLRAWLADRGYEQVEEMDLDVHEQGDWSINLPIERSRTWSNLARGAVQRWDCTAADCQQVELDPLERSFFAPAIFDYDLGQDTLTEWKLDDLNQDGFLDFYAANQPARRCLQRRFGGLGTFQCGTNPGQQPPGTYYCSDQVRDYVITQEYCDDSQDPSIPDPLPQSAYNVNVAFLNQLGPFTAVARSPFASSPAPWGGGTHGVESWVQDAEDRDEPVGTVEYPEGTSPPDHLGLTWQRGGLDDPARSGWLRDATHATFSSSTTRFDSDQSVQCQVDGQPHRTRQFRGLADLNGDGLADRIEHLNGAWEVRFATAAQGDAGGGFGPSRALVGHALTDFEVALSETSGTCGDGVVHTTAGLTDMDGDGRPELVRGYPDGTLWMSRLTTAEGPAGLGAGKLVSIDNRRGAKTLIEYANRKQVGLAGDRLPYPEVVVAAVRTEVTDGSAADSAPTYYAYGRPSTSYDPLAGHWVFDGYGRTAMASGTPNAWIPGAIDGVITVDERSPAAPAGAVYAAHVKGRQPVSTTMVERFAVTPDLLRQFLQPDGVAFAGQTTTYTAKTLVEPLWPPEAARIDCGDLDRDTGALVGAGRCGAAGLLQVSATESWEGLGGPPSTANVVSAAEVVATDAFGRPTRMHNRGDLRRRDDDRCTSITYAATVDGRPFPSVPARVTMDDCGFDSPEEREDPPLVVLSSTGYRWDELAEGSVGVGNLTSRSVDRYGPTGHLDTLVGEELEYGAFGQVALARSTRLLGIAATRETHVTYDPFGATATAVTVTATGLAPRSTTTSASTWPSRPTVATGPTGVVTTVTRDGYGRPLTLMSRPAGGADQTLRRMTYHDGDDGQWRRVEVDVFPDGATPGAEASAPGRQRSEVVLDAFGRARYQRRQLGADYGQSMLVSGLVTYDALGRVAFEAEPFEVKPGENLSIFDPALMTQPAYGRSTVYDLRGRVSRSILATGYNDQAWTSSLATNTFVSSVSYGYLNGQAWASVVGPDGNDPTSENPDVRATSWTTATGRELERATYAAVGTTLDRLATETDRLGRVIRTRRFGPEGTAPVVWQASYDSLGRQLSMQEPGASPQLASYDEDGNLLETRWQDGSQARITRQQYDALGRVTERVLAHANTAGVETVESTDRFHYDEAFGPHPAGAGAYLGRLAAATTDGVGGVYYAYDALGRPVTTTYDYASQQVVRESAAWTVGGQLTDLTLDAAGTIDQIHYAYDSAARVRQVRDGAAPTTVYFDASTITADGHYQQVTYGNGVVAQFHRQPGGRRLLADWSVSTASGAHAFANTYDAAGRLRHETHDLPGSLAELDRRYDGLGRLTGTWQVGGTDPGAEFYTYDSLGNLTTRTASTAAGSREYTRDAADPDRLCHYAPIGQAWGPCQYRYDGAGNVVEDTTQGTGLMGQRVFSYDSGQRLTAIHRGAVTATFTYGPLGRVSTAIAGPTPREVWSFGGLVEKRVRPDGTAQLERRIPGPLGVIATLRHDGTNQTVVYGHGDGRGARFFTDGTGHVVQATTYGAYGRVTADSGAGSPLTYTDDLWNGGDDLRELGVVMLGPRAYDPDLGRFLQRDPIIHTGSGSQGNPYSFAFGDPVNFADPSGLGPVDTGAGAPSAPRSQPAFFDWAAMGSGGTPRSTPAPTAVPSIGPVTPPSGPADVALLWAQNLGNNWDGVVWDGDAVANQIIGHPAFRLGRLAWEEGPEMIMSNLHTADTLGTIATCHANPLNCIATGERIQRSVEFVIDNPGTVAREAFLPQGELDRGAFRIVGGGLLGGATVSILGRLDRALFSIGPYRPTIAGLQNHHGIMDRWASANVPGYVSRGADTPTMALTDLQHAAATAVWREWLFERTGRKVGGSVDWTQVSARDMQSLTYRMFDAAGAPAAAQAAYFQAFHQYIYGVAP